MKKIYQEKLELFLRNNNDLTFIPHAIIALSIIVVAIWGCFYQQMFREEVDNVIDHILLVSSLAIWAAFAFNVRLTIILISDQMPHKNSRDIMTPNWQNRSNIIIIWGFIYFVITGLFVFKLWVFPIWFFSLFCLTSIFKRLVVAKPMSKYIVMKLKNHLMQEKNKFTINKQKAELKKIDDILVDFDKICRNVICS